jgi:hypothetical protein
MYTREAHDQTPEKCNHRKFEVGQSDLCRVSIPVLAIKNAKVSFSCKSYISWFHWIFVCTLDQLSVELVRFALLHVIAYYSFHSSLRKEQ